MKHIGFIMDGNRTWAKERWLASHEGHSAGIDVVESVILGCLEKKVECASFWGLSDDNIRERSALELKFLFDLFEKFFQKFLQKAQDNNIRLHFVGDRTLLRADCREIISEAEEVTKNNSAMNVIFALGYGGQEEIARAVQSLARSGADMTKVTREDIFAHLETGKFPPVDLIVRTGGHIRHSGYFLYQSPYAEYFFSSKNWPEFDREELDKCFASFAERKRKFGK